MQGLALSVFAAVALVAAVWLGRLALVHWRYGRLQGRTALLGAAMDLYGVTPRDADAAGFGPSLWAAGRRCSDCAQARACRHWLAEGQRSELARNCPNAGMLGATARHRSVIEAGEMIEGAPPPAPLPAPVTLQAMRFWQ